MKEKSYDIGSIFMWKRCGEKEYYILCQVGMRAVCLVSLIDGNRWRQPVKVSCATWISDRELKDVTSEEDYSNFRLVKPSKVFKKNIWLKK